MFYEAAELLVILCHFLTVFGTAKFEDGFSKLFNSY